MGTDLKSVYFNNNTTNQSKLVQLDSKINLLDNILNDKVNELEKSFNFLKEKLNKVSVFYDKEKVLRDNYKNNYSEELISFDKNLHSMIAEEKQVSNKYFIYNFLKSIILVG